MLQHYLSLDGETKEPFLVCMTFGCSSGTHTINSSSLQFRASQIRFKCSRFTLSTNSWYNSLIVFGRISVALAKSACVHLSSPSFVDSKILIILIAPSVIKYHISAMPYGKSYFIADMDNSYQL